MEAGRASTKQRRTVRVGPEQVVAIVTHTDGAIVAKTRGVDGFGRTIVAQGSAAQAAVVAPPEERKLLAALKAFAGVAITHPVLLVQ